MASAFGWRGAVLQWSADAGRLTVLCVGPYASVGVQECGRGVLWSLFEGGGHGGMDVQTSGGAQGGPCLEC